MVDLKALCYLLSNTANPDTREYNYIEQEEYKKWFLFAQHLAKQGKAIWYIFAL